jgi:hypothetical protein
VTPDNDEEGSCDQTVIRYDSVMDNYQTRPGNHHLKLKNLQNERLRKREQSKGQNSET